MPLPLCVVTVVWDGADRPKYSFRCYVIIIGIHGRGDRGQNVRGSPTKTVDAKRGDTPHVVYHLFLAVYSCIISSKEVIVMELYQEMLTEILRWEELEVRFPQMEGAVEKIVDQRCYQALKQIRDILRNEQLSDPECFQQIEEIICVLESQGSGGGLRHGIG